MSYIGSINKRKVHIRFPGQEQQYCLREEICVEMYSAIYLCNYGLRLRTSFIYLREFPSTSAFINKCNLLIRPSIILDFLYCFYIDNINTKTVYKTTTRLDKSF